MPGIANTLAPEEKTIIEDVISLLSQLAAMQEGTEQPAEVAIEEAIDEDADMQEVDVEKASDGNTGQGDAETRLNDDQTETTDESLSDLKKSIETLTSVISGKRVVQKKKISNPMMEQLKKLEKGLQGIVNHQSAQDKFNLNLLNAFGFSEDVIQKTLKEEEVKKKKPVQTLDHTAMVQNVVKDVVTEVVKSLPQLNQNTNPEYQNSFNQKRASEVDKDMIGVLDYIHKGAAEATVQSKKQ